MKNTICLSMLLTLSACLSLASASSGAQATWACTQYTNNSHFPQRVTASVDADYMQGRFGDTPLVRSSESPEWLKDQSGNHFFFNTFPLLADDPNLRNLAIRRSDNLSLFVLYDCRVEVSR